MTLTPSSPTRIEYRVRRSGSDGLWYPERRIDGGPWRRPELRWRRKGKGYETKVGAMRLVREWVLSGHGMWAPDEEDGGQQP